MSALRWWLFPIAAHCSDLKSHPKHASLRQCPVVGRTRLIIFNDSKSRKEFRWRNFVFQKRRKETLKFIVQTSTIGSLQVENYRVARNRVHLRRIREQVPSWLTLVAVFSVPPNLHLVFFSFVSALPPLPHPRFFHVAKRLSCISKYLYQYAEQDHNVLPRFRGPFFCDFQNSNATLETRRVRFSCPESLRSLLSLHTALTLHL